MVRSCGVTTAAMFALSTLASGQSSSVDKEAVVALSPFVVDASTDVGYAANNTLAGTRLNSSLRDTAASISVWTPEFIDDTGFTNIEELIAYSANTVLDTNDARAGGFFNTYTNAANVTQLVRTRGIPASKSIDYFKAIIPNDSYRVDRYDDARGPNGVLFGVSSAGGLINESSLEASLNRNSGRLRYSTGSNSRDRAEFRVNHVLVPDRWALAVAGLKQQNGHWRDFASDDRDRIYLATTWDVNDRIRLRANYEKGRDHQTTVQPTAPMDEGLPFLDNLLAFGIDAVTFTPTGGIPPTP
jgi:iron complex outermembrane receptor protein